MDTWRPFILSKATTFTHLYIKKKIPTKKILQIVYLQSYKGYIRAARFISIIVVVWFYVVFISFKKSNVVLIGHLCCMPLFLMDLTCILSHRNLIHFFVKISASYKARNSLSSIKDHLIPNKNLDFTKLHIVFVNIWYNITLSIK